MYTNFKDLHEAYGFDNPNKSYEAYNSFGEFVTSGDTYKECEDDLIEMLVEDARMGNIREKVSAWVNIRIDTRDRINIKVNL